MREDWESHTGHQPGAEPWHTRHFGTMSRAQQNLEIYKVMLCGHMIMTCLHADLCKCLRDI